MLEVRNVCAGYHGIEIVHNISFQLEKGENMCILGANGCGKTTFLRTIGNLIPFTGSIRLDGIELKTMKRRVLAEKVAMLSQISGTYFAYTVYDTVMLGRYQQIRRTFSDRPSRLDREAVERCLHTVGLTDFADRKINELSGGQLQRVFLAKALAQDPQIILLDEPTNHLDIRQQAELIQYLKKWSENGAHTVIGVFHDIRLALQFSDKVLFMKDGSQKAFGTLEEIATRELLRDVYDLDITEYLDAEYENWKTISAHIKRAGC